MNLDDKQGGGTRLFRPLPIALWAFGGLTACQPTSAPQTDLSGIESRLASLEAGAGGADLAHDNFTTSLEGVEARLAALEAKANSQLVPRDFASFKPTDQGYATIQTNVVPLLVSFNAVESMGNGTKLLLNVGNMTTAGFTGSEVTVQYLRAIKDGATGSAGPFTATSRFTGTLRPGAWTVVPVPLSEVKPDELSFIIVSIKLDVLELR